MALSLLWSYDWRQGLYQLTNAAALLAVFLWVRRFPRFVPEAACVAVCLALILQYLYPLDYGGHGNRNFQTEVLLIGLALCRPIPGLILAFPVFGYLWFNESKIEWFALLCVVLFYLLRAVCEGANAWCVTRLACRALDQQRKRVA